MQDTLMKFATVPENISYQWRETPGWKWIGDAEEIGRHIEMMAEDKNGFLTTKDIVDDARSPHSPLYPNFEHDDLKAAENWREQTARTLIGSLLAVRVVHEEGKPEPKEISVRAFVNVTMEGQHYYSPVFVVVRQGDLKDQYIKRLITEMNTWRRKAAEFQVFSAVVEAIDNLPSLLPEAA